MTKQISYFDPRNPGWMNEQELGVIKDACRGKGDVLEIGCYCGRSTQAILEVTTGLVHAIDPLHRNGWMPTWPHPGELHLNAHAHMADLVAKYPARLIVIPAFSREMFKLFKRSVDVLMIDSDHSYDSTREEIDAFTSCLNLNGVLIFDDFDLEPVSSAWNNSRFRGSHPWLTVERAGSLGIVRYVPEVSQPAPSTETPV